MGELYSKVQDETTLNKGYFSAQRVRVAFEHLADCPAARGRTDYVMPGKHQNVRDFITLQRFSFAIRWSVPAAAAGSVSTSVLTSPSS